MLQQAFSSTDKKSLEVLSLHWGFHACVLESMKIEKENYQHSTEGNTKSVDRFWEGDKEKTQMPSTSTTSPGQMFPQ